MTIGLSPCLINTLSPIAKNASVISLRHGVRILPMKHLYLPAISHCLIGALARAGIWLHPSDRILDIGCGSGGLVARLRELGFDAFGVDVETAWKSRSVWQHAWFQQIGKDDNYKLPFDDQHFDVVITTHVIEHVADLDSFFKEAARVLRAGGAMANMYPSRACPIEAHTYIPFYPWLPFDFMLRLAARAGIRNEFQKGLNDADVIDSNRRYFKDGAFIYAASSVKKIALRHFDVCDDLAPAYYADRPRGLRLLMAYIRAAMKDEMPLRGLAFFQRMEMPLFKKKVVEPSTGG